MATTTDKLNAFRLDVDLATLIEGAFSEFLLHYERDLMGALVSVERLYSDLQTVDLRPRECASDLIATAQRLRAATAKLDSIAGKLMLLADLNAHVLPEEQVDEAG